MHLVDRNGKALPQEHKVLSTMASYESMEARCDLTRGVMTLPQTEMWHFIISEPMRALRKQLLTTARAPSHVRTRVRPQWAVREARYADIGAAEVQGSVAGVAEGATPCGPWLLHLGD